MASQTQAEDTSNRQRGDIKDDCDDDVPLIIDMGAHWLEGIVPNRSENLPASLCGTKITQASLKQIYYPFLVTKRSRLYQHRITLLDSAAPHE